MALRGVLFDLFDTLVDLHMDRLPPVEIDGRRHPSTLGALHRAFGRFAELDLEAFAAELRRSDRELFPSHYAKGIELPTLERFAALCRRLGVDDPEAPELLTRTHMGQLREQIRLLPHHRDVLAELAPRFSLAVVSNFSHSPLALKTLDEAGLRGHLDNVVISEEVRFRKPRPEIFQAALGNLGLQAAEVLHVGDSLRDDIGGGAALGIATVWITRRIADPEAALAAHEGPPPAHVIRDLTELPELLRGREGTGA
ncbi:MAG: HAD family hydrolase [Proteobacteria bacterium]|nr:HAD family hydrolase [Pseudomonadota bacterium]